MSELHEDEDDLRDIAYVLAILRCDPLDPRWDIESAPFLWRGWALQTLRGVERSEFFKTHRAQRYFLAGPSRMALPVPAIIR